jgi:hypothetical protein
MTPGFLERAAQLGHSPELLANGHEVTTVIQVPHIDALKSFIEPGADVSTRQNVGRALFGEPALTHPEQDASAGGILGRVNAFLYDHAELSGTDRSRIANAFPLTLTATSIPAITLYGPWELGTSAPAILTYNVGTLTLEDGGCVNVRNSMLQFSVDTVVRDGGPPPGSSDFNVLGVTGGAGAIGANGGSGGTGAQGSRGTCASPGVAGSSGGNGSPGYQGADGGTGGRGGDGLPSMAATFTITTAISGTAPALTFRTQSGAGGPGGKGGTGGPGGYGGGGGDGETCGCEGTNGGHGGPGGQGGNGGVGGNGGNGVGAAGNVVIKVPPELIDKIAPGVELAAPGGDGGEGGDPGPGGSGGGAGGGGKHASDGNWGGPGGPGNPGQRGNPSPVQGMPGTIFSPQPI